MAFFLHSTVKAALEEAISKNCTLRNGIFVQSNSGPDSREFRYLISWVLHCWNYISFRKGRSTTYLIYQVNQKYLEYLSGVTRISNKCYPGVTRISTKFYPGVTRISITKCYPGVTRLSIQCYLRNIGKYTKIYVSSVLKTEYS